MTQAELCLNPSVSPIDEDRLSKQQLALLERLRKGPMTNIEGMTQLLIFNLSARVSELRQAGFDVRATRVNGGLWSYRLVPTAEELKAHVMAGAEWLRP